jgi:hypothetical protein
LLAFNFYPQGNHNILIDGQDHSSFQVDSLATKGYVPLNIKGESFLHPLEIHIPPYYTFNNPKFDKLFMIQIHHLWQ